MAGRAGLSDEQAQALDLERHLVVTAGAGSGKTRTLVRRYLRALCALGNPGLNPSNKPAGPESIVVSTFTERAAAELRRRLRAELLGAIRELSDDSAALRDDAPDGASRALMLRHLRNCHANFDRARVGTFHSFCASILRECAAELGIDPGFSVLQGALAKRMLDDAVMAAIETAERSVELERSDEACDLSSLFRAMTRRDLIQATTTWVDSRENLKPFRTTLQEHDDEELLQVWQDRYASGRLEALEDGMAPGSPLTNELAMLQALIEPAGAELTAPLFEACRIALQTTARAPGDDLVARADRIRSFMKPFQTQDGRIRARLSAGKQGDKQMLRDARDHWERVREMLSALCGKQCEALEELPGPADRLAGPILRALCWLGDEAIRGYQQAKSQAHALDFADLQLLVLELLRTNPGVRTRLQGRFSHFMIDEFQDTNGIQWAILRLLCDEFRQEGGLFLVGDPKQAIYRFRGGDVTLFDRAIDEVCKAGGAVVAFSANYRSQPALIGAFNSLFAWLLDSDRPERPSWEAPFQSLHPGRKPNDKQEDNGNVELLWLGEPGNDDIQGPELPVDDLLRFVPQGAEAWTVATWLRERHLPHGGATRAMQAAVLVRRRRHLPTYAMALRRAGVAACVVGGRGFFSRQEVHDITNLLLALAHRDDVVALLGALRGPYLNLTDEWLLWLAKLGREGGPWALRVGWDRMLQGTVQGPDHLPDAWAELPASAQTELNRAARAYLQWQQARKHLPVSEFLRKILNDSAGIHLFARNDPTGQALANVEKLVSVAADYDSLGPDGVADFALYLRNQEELEAEEGDAPLDEVAPVVLMTIHQSKGLEFPTVVLPDLHQPLRKGLSDPLVLGRLGQRIGADELWEPGIRVPVEAARRTMEPTLLRKLVVRRARHEDIAESRRLLYVGMTRAENQLVCVAEQPTNNEPRGREHSKSWEEWLRSWLTESEPEHISVFQDLDPWNAAGESVHSGRQRLADDSSRALKPLSAAELEQALRPIPREQSHVLSPHALAAPRPASRQVAPAAPRAKSALEGSLMGRLRGTLVHSCLEDGLSQGSDALRRRVHQQATSAGLWKAKDRNALLLEVESHLQGFQNAAPAPLCGQDSLHVLREVPFRLPVPMDSLSSVKSVWLEGVIDVLYRDPTRRLWVVLDYKTDHRDPSRLVAEYRGQLLAYAWAASRIIPELREDGWQLAAELLMTAHGQCQRIFGPEDPGTVAAEFAELLRGVLPAPAATHAPGL